MVALGITTEGVKLPLGRWSGSTENATVATALLSDLVERGIDPEQGILFVIDGAKALRRAIRDVFGEQAPIQRCVRHKERNVLEHLPERDRAQLRRRLRAAWALDDAARAESASAAGHRAGAPASGGGRLTAGGPGRDAHPAAARDHRAAQAHARVHEPDRVDDRDASGAPSAT